MLEVFSLEDFIKHLKENDVKVAYLAITNTESSKIAERKLRYITYKVSARIGDFIVFYEDTTVMEEKDRLDNFWKEIKKEFSKHKIELRGGQWHA